MTAYAAELAWMLTLYGLATAAVLFPLSPERIHPVDLSPVLNMLPAQYVAVLLAVAGLCAGVSALLPPPKSATGVYAWTYAAVNFVGVNLGHAKNAAAPATPSVPKVAPVWILAALAALALSACTSAGGLTPAAQDAVNNACAKAPVLQGEALTAAELIILASPLAGPDGNTVAQAVANGAAVDQTVVRPLVVDLCAKLVH